MKQALRPVEATPASVLSRLRSTLPTHAVTYAESLRVAERLAKELLGLFAVETMPVPAEIVSTLPRIAVELDAAMPDLTSGLSVWDAQRKEWVISLNRREPVTRQRFTTLHEFFHIVVHQHASAGLFRRLSGRQVEFAADYFAGCVLVPKRFLVRAWASGLQQVEALASQFNVSPRAIEVRLSQVRLTGVTAEYQSADDVPAEVA